jgi:hypothetical protein
MCIETVNIRMKLWNNKRMKLKAREDCWNVEEYTKLWISPQKQKNANSVQKTNGSIVDMPNVGFG